MPSSYFSSQILAVYFPVKRITTQYLPSVRWHYKEGFYFMFLEEGVPFMTVSRLHLIVSI